MQYSVMYRAQTQQERACLKRPRLGARIGPVLEGTGCFLAGVLILFLCACVLAAIAHSLESKGLVPAYRPGPVASVLMIVLLYAPIFGIPAWFGWRRYRDYRRRNRLILQDIARGEVEVIRVRAARYLQVIQKGVGFYLVGIGPGTMMYLADIRDPEVFGLSLFDELDEEEGGNDSEDDEELQASFPFPCADFTLHRFPHVGTVLRIEAQSARIEAEGCTDEARLPDFLRRHLDETWAMQVAILEQDFERVLGTLK